ncbi:MAG: hypothetical protein NVSMB3_10220 [Acidobacteriaceae bacterium]
MNVSFRFALRLVPLLAVLSMSAPRATAQAPGSDYTAALPSVEKVKAQLKGSDPTDTIARQVAVFTYLQTYIQRIKDTRNYGGPYTPGEEKLVRDYSLAAYQLSQDFTKKHTPAEVSAFQQVEGRYEINNALNWIKQLEGQQAADTYTGTESALAQSYKQHEEKLQQQLKQDQGGGSSSLANDPVLDPMGLIARGQASMENDPKTRRCLELGSSLDECEGVGALLDMTSLLLPGAGADDPNAPPPVVGVVLSGNYRSRSELPSLSFGAGSATLQDCGSLVPDDHPYTLRKSGSTVQLVLYNEPQPIVMTMQPDGTLSGPGSILVKGRVITGYTTTTNQVMVNGAPAASQGYYCNGPCTTTSSIPNYAPKIDRCTIASVAPVAPKPVAVHKTGIGFLDAMSTSTPLVTGLRMTGQFSAPSGMVLAFANDMVTLDCGKAHVKTPYRVENTPTQFVVHVQNAGGAFLLGLAPDNALRGSGSTSVNGKLVSAIHGENVTFTPHSETCNVESFRPRGKRNTMLASNAPLPALPASYSATPTATDAAAPKPASAPAPPAISASLAGAGIAPTPGAARAPLRVLLSSNFTGANPLAGQAVFVARKPMDQILRELGVSVPAKATPAQALKALQTLCHSPQGCAPMMQKLPSYYVATTRLDTAGKATLNTTAATGQYYFFAIVPTSAGTLMWNVAAALAAGDNPVTFTQANSERVQ